MKIACLLLFGQMLCFADPTILRFGKVAHTSPRDVIVNHHPLTQYLAQATKVEKVEFLLFPTHEILYAKLEKGELDLVWLGTVFYASLKSPQGVLLVAPAWNGKTTYEGAIMILKNSPIQEAADLAGKKIAFVSKESASGYFFPRLLLKSAGLQEADFSKEVFLKSHEAVVYGVLSGHFEAGATYIGVFSQKDLQDKQDLFRILLKTDPIPNEPILARKGLEESLIMRLRSAFLDSKAAMAASKIPSLTGFTAVQNQDYASVRKLVGHVQ